MPCLPRTPVDFRLSAMHDAQQKKQLVEGIQKAPGDSVHYGSSSKALCRSVHPVLEIGVLAMVVPLRSENPPSLAKRPRRGLIGLNAISELM